MNKISKLGIKRRNSRSNSGVTVNRLTPQAYRYRLTPYRYRGGRRLAGRCNPDLHNFEGNFVGQHKAVPQCGTSSLVWQSVWYSGRSCRMASPERKMVRGRWSKEPPTPPRAQPYRSRLGSTELWGSITFRKTKLGGLERRRLRIRIEIDPGSSIARELESSREAWTAD